MHFCPVDSTSVSPCLLLKSFLTGKKSEGVTKMLQEYFASVPNPYEATLRVMWSCGDFNLSKQSSLAFAGQFLVVRSNL